MIKEELVLIVGGSNISGTILNAIVRAINAALEVGRSLGTAIRRVKTRQICPIK